VTDEIEKRNGFKGQVDHAFRPGYGSILFFEDQAVLDEFSGKMPAYSAVRLSRASRYPPILTLLPWHVHRSTCNSYALCARDER
jgi:predicted oxidoreductase (fatty acid repression mutant protein)